MPPPEQEPDTTAALPLITDIQRAVHILGLHLESALADCRLSQGEIHVLSLLGHAGTLSVTELQRGVRHRPSTLTGILDRLGAKGLVERRINEADRRSNLIELTGPGREAANRVIAVMAEVERMLLASCSAQGLEAMRDVLDAVARSS